MRTRLLPLLLLAGLACGDEAPAPVYQAIPVERRSITVSVQAAGTVQPDTLVEVKSKASGEILDLKVETGQQVVVQGNGDTLHRDLPPSTMTVVYRALSSLS